MASNPSEQVAKLKAPSSARIERVDPRLVDILQSAAENFPYRVEVTPSGGSNPRKSGGSQHNHNRAIDIQIYDENGKPIPNYQNGSTFRLYEQFAQAAREVQQEKYPDLNKAIRWGGYFSGKKNYGALDLMHFDLGGIDGLGMKGGSWEKGLTDAQKKLYPTAESYGLSDPNRNTAVVPELKEGTWPRVMPAKSRLAVDPSDIITSLNQSQQVRQVKPGPPELVDPSSSEDIINGKGNSSLLAYSESPQTPNTLGVQVATNKSMASINDMSDEEIESKLFGTNPPINQQTIPTIVKDLPEWSLPARFKGAKTVDSVEIPDVSDDELEKILLSGNTEATKEIPLKESIPVPIDPDLKARREFRDQWDRAAMSSMPLGGPFVWLLGQGRLDETDDSWKGFKNSNQTEDDKTIGKERDSWKDVAGHTGIGALRGMSNVRDTLEAGIGRGINYLTSKVAPQSVADYVDNQVNQQIEDNRISREAVRNEYKNRLGFSLGETMGEIAATAPAWAAGPVAGLAARGGSIVPTAIGSRIATGALGGAMGGAVMNAGTSEAYDKPVLDHIAEGAKGGAIAGGALSAAGSVARGVANKLVGRTDPITRKLAERAEEMGIELRGSQVSNSQPLKKLDQISGQLPGSGGAKQAAKQQAQFNRAVAKTFGEDAETITPEVIEQARNRLGKEFERIGKSSTVNVDGKMTQDLRKILDEGRDHMVDSQFKVVASKVNDIIKMVGDKGHLTGEQYQSLVRKDTPLWRATKSTDPDVRYYASQVREALDGALERSISPELKTQLKDTRRQWKAMKTIEGLADKGVGDVSPQLLMGKVMQSPGGKSGSGNLGELADIGKRFLKEPKDSGTPQGNLMVNMLTNPISAVGATAAGMAAKLPYAAEAGMALAANRALLREGLLNRKYFKNAILGRNPDSKPTFSRSVRNKLIPMIGVQANGGDQ